MLFITNRALNEGIQSEIGRSVSFDLSNNGASPSVFYCERTAKGRYTEIGAGSLMERLKTAKKRQILLYVHGYSNLPEPDIFPRAEMLQAMLDAQKKDEVLVVPLIWPCDGDFGIIKDYYDDQTAADESGPAFARVFGKFLNWRERNLANDTPCLKRVSVLAHSMGNRVLCSALCYTVDNSICPHGPPLVFRNIFLVAADLANEIFEKGRAGEHIPPSTRNTVVYFAADDLAMRASKVANLANNIASRRLGHTGPEDMGKVASNVMAVDCDDVNNQYDNPKGHSYFLGDGTKANRPGRVFLHIWETIRTGRPPAG